MRQEDSLDLGTVLINPLTFCASGPIKNSNVKMLLCEMEGIPDHQVGCIIKSFVQHADPKELGEALQNLVEALPTEEIGQFMKGRAKARLERA